MVSKTIGWEFESLPECHTYGQFMRIQKLLEAGVDDFSDFDTDATQLDKDMVKKDEKIIPAMVPCPACRGKGRKTIGYQHPRVVQCFECNGKGEVHPKRQERKEAFKKGLTTKANNLKAKIEQFITENPDAYQWIEKNKEKGGFAAAMADSLKSFGGLTPNQLAAVNRSVETYNTKKVEFAAKDEANKAQLGEGAGKILETLQRAKSNKIARPKMRTGELDFSLAPEHGNNPGCVYVNSHGLYVGKITPDGAFRPSRDCTDEMKAKVVEVALDPLAAAVLHGRQTGTCSCCGRQLDNAESVELGIGPICRSKYF